MKKAFLKAGIKESVANAAVFMFTGKQIEKFDPVKLPGEIQFRDVSSPFFFLFFPSSLFPALFPLSSVPSSIVAIRQRILESSGSPCRIDRNRS